MVWNWPQHFERSKSHVQHGIWTAKTTSPWLSPYFDPEKVSEWFNIDLTKTAQDFGLKKIMSKKIQSSSDQNLACRSSVVELKIQEVFVSPLQSLEYDSIPKSLAAQLLGSNEKKRRWHLEVWFVFFWGVMDVGLNILKMRKHFVDVFEVCFWYMGGKSMPLLPNPWISRFFFLLLACGFGNIFLIFTAFQEGSFRDTKRDTGGSQGEVSRTRRCYQSWKVKWDRCHVLCWPSGCIDKYYMKD